MALLRYQFTLRQLIKLVALAAVCFAIFRTPAWPILVAVGLVLPGFAIDRARGGAGLLGAILAGMIGFVGIGITFFVYARLVRHQPYDDLPLLFPVLVFFGLMGLIWGFFVGVWTGLIVFLIHRRSGPEPSQSESCGPIYWRDLEIPHEATNR